MEEGAGPRSRASPEYNILYKDPLHLDRIYLYCLSLLTCNVVCTHDYTGITLTNITIVNKASVLQKILLESSFGDIATSRHGGFVMKWACDFFCDL